MELCCLYLSWSTVSVTWRNFCCPIESRTERWRVRLKADGRLEQIEHRVPEATAGANLERAEALELAGATLQQLGWGDPTQLDVRSEEHTSELQSRGHLVCRLLLEKKK